MIEEAIIVQHRVLKIPKLGKSVFNEVIQLRQRLRAIRGKPKRVQISKGIAKTRPDKVKDLMRQALTTPATTVCAPLDDALPSLEQ